MSVNSHRSGRHKAVCDRTGRYGYSDEFVRDPYGYMVLKTEVDKPHPLEKPFKEPLPRVIPWARDDTVGANPPEFTKITTIQGLIDYNKSVS